MIIGEGVLRIHARRIYVEVLFLLWGVAAAFHLGRTQRIVGVGECSFVSALISYICRSPRHFWWHTLPADEFLPLLLEPAVFLSTSTIEYIEAHQMEGVTEEHGFDVLVEWARAGQGWGHVDFQQPRLQILINEHIESIYLEALPLMLGRPHGRRNRRLYCHQCLQTNVFDFSEYFSVVYSHFGVLILQLLETPFEFHFLLRLVLCRVLLGCRAVRVLVRDVRVFRVLVFDVGVSLLVHRVIGEMDESLLQAAFGCGVRLGCQTHEAVLENVGLERFVAGDHDVDSQVILVATQEMGFREVLGDQVALALVDGVLLADDLDAPPATSSSGLENVHVFKIIHLTVVDPALVVLRENVSGRTQLELFAVLPPLFLHIPPQVGLATHGPRASKMVELLVLVHELQLGGPY